MTDPVRVTSDYDGVLAERVEALERLTDRMLRCLLWPNATLIEATPDLSRQWRARPHTELSGWSESRDAQLYERV